MWITYWYAFEQSEKLHNNEPRTVFTCPEANLFCYGILVRGDDDLEHAQMINPEVQ